MTCEAGDGLRVIDIIGLPCGTDTQKHTSEIQGELKRAQWGGSESSQVRVDHDV